MQKTILTILVFCVYVLFAISFPVFAQQSAPLGDRIEVKLEELKIEGNELVFKFAVIQDVDEKNPPLALSDQDGVYLNGVLQSGGRLNDKHKFTNGQHIAESTYRYTLPDDLDGKAINQLRVTVKDLSIQEMYEENMLYIVEAPGTWTVEFNPMGTPKAPAQFDRAEKDVSWGTYIKTGASIYLRIEKVTAEKDQTSAVLSLRGDIPNVFHTTILTGYRNFGNNQPKFTFLPLFNERIFFSFDYQTQNGDIKTWIGETE